MQSAHRLQQISQSLRKASAAALPLSMNEKTLRQGPTLGQKIVGNDLIIMGDAGLAGHSTPVLITEMNDSNEENSASRIVVALPL